MALSWRVRVLDKITTIIKFYGVIVHFRDVYEEPPKRENKLFKKKA